MSSTLRRLLESVLYFVYGAFRGTNQRYEPVPLSSKEAAMLQTPDDPTRGQRLEPSESPAKRPPKTRPPIDHLPLATQRRVVTIRSISAFLDNSIKIPGLKYQIGIDPLIGLIPVVGDICGLAVGSFLISLGSHYGLPRRALFLMLCYQAVDTIVGFVPIFGDLFDFVFKANEMNLDIMERYLVDPNRAQKRTNKIYCCVISIILLVFVVNVIIGVLFVWWIVTLIKK